MYIQVIVVMSVMCRLTLFFDRKVRCDFFYGLTLFEAFIFAKNILRLAKAKISNLQTPQSSAQHFYWTVRR